MSTACQGTAPDVQMADIAGKYLTFRLGPESYAIKVTQVR
jgi:chemotaxis signal transduction protein